MNMQERWAAPVEDSEFKDLPEGRYNVEIIDAEMGETKDTGNPMLTWSLAVLDGEYAGRLMWKRSVITDHPTTINILKSELLICEFACASFADMPRRVKELTGIKMEVKVKVKGAYTNIDVVKLLGPINRNPAPAPAQPESATQPEDDIPF